MKYIDKSTFNKLSVKEQIKVFNSLLLEHDNIKEVCNIIGISYSTIRDRFHKNKYSFNKFNHQYELTSTVKHKNDELEKIIEDVVKNMDRKSLEPISEGFKDKVTVRSFRIYKSVLEDFSAFCENSMLTQYDVLSLFLLEGMERYKKNR